MNDRFGICLKNNESNFNPLNDPANNVYGVNRLLFSEILMKNKKKYPSLYGNNIYSPDYLQINGLGECEIYKRYAPRYTERKKMVPEPDKSLLSQSKGKRCISELNNKESKDTLNDFTIPKLTIFQKKYRNEYNIINHREVKTQLGSPIQSKYLSKLAELNLKLHKNEKNHILAKLNNNHRLNDGIYDYLKQHNYV